MVGLKSRTNSIDPDLARRAASDSLALETLLKDYATWFRSRIRVAAHRSCPNGAIKEDFAETVHSEVLFRIQKILSAWGNGSLEAYLSESIDNTARDVSRNMRARRRWGERVALDEGAQSSGLSPEKEAQNRERARILWGAIQSMAAESDTCLKWALVMRYVCLEGVLPEDLATRLGVQRALVDQWKRRGMIRLGHILAARGHTPENLL